MTQPWLEEKIYYQHEAYFAALLHSFEAARYSIELETYIFENDYTGRSVIEGLIKARARGVKVRVVLDGMGSRLWLDEVVTALEKGSVQVRVYHPFPFPKSLRVLIQAFNQLNKRLHRKVCIIDHKMAMVGSFNITRKSHRDTAIQVKGTQVNILVGCFEKVWKHHWNFGWAGKYKLSSVRLNVTQRLRKLSNDDLISRFTHAKSRIWITNAYFVPPLPLLSAIVNAGKRGVDVRLLVPRKSDHIFMKWMSEAYFKNLILNGVKVYAYHGPFLHAKTLIVDDWTIVGTSNMNHRSVIHDLEVDIVVTHESTKKSLIDQFEIDLFHSSEITLEDLNKISILYILLRWVLSFFRNWV